MAQASSVAVHLTQLLCKTYLFLFTQIDESGDSHAVAGVKSRATRCPGKRGLRSEQETTPGVCSGTAAM